jgi:hypothetical protein
VSELELRIGKLRRFRCVHIFSAKLCAYYLLIKHILFRHCPIYFSGILKLKQRPSLPLGVGNAGQRYSFNYQFLEYFCLLNAFHTVYLRSAHFRLNARLCTFSTFRIVFILSCISLRWPPFTRSPYKLHFQTYVTLLMQMITGTTNFESTWTVQRWQQNKTHNNIQDTKLRLLNGIRTCKVWVIVTNNHVLILKTRMIDHL